MPLSPLWLRVEDLVHQIAKFGVVGLVALVVDVGLFNLLRFAGGEGPFYDKPLTAKVISVIVATTVAYIGNRIWTFSDRGRTSYAREYFLFFLLNGIALLITLSVLWFSHYALGLTSPLADNISRQRDRPGPGNVVPVLVLPQVGVPGVASRGRRRRVAGLSRSGQCSEADVVGSAHPPEVPTRPRTGAPLIDRQRQVTARGRLPTLRPA